MALRQVGRDVLLFLIVKPNRPKSAILGWREGTGRAPGETVTELEVALAAQPADGAANAELIALLARTFSLPKREVELDAGATSRHKVVRLRDTTVPQLEAKLLALGVR